jgi:signal transduction histidine kinase
MEEPEGGPGRRRSVPPLSLVSSRLLPHREGRLRRLGYAALSIPLAVVYAALFAGLVVAVVTALQVIGLLLFPVVLALARAFGGLERRVTRRLLDVEVEDGVRLRRKPGSLFRRLRGLLISSSTWRTVAWLAARTLFGAGVLATMASGVGLSVLLLNYDEWTGWSRTPLLSFNALAAVLLVVVVVLRVLDLEVRIMAGAAPTLLGVSTAERMAALRQTSLRLAARNSVARELHDTIGHTLTASLLQAEAARRTLTPNPATEKPVDPAFALQALAHIENNTRAALAELDQALAVLGGHKGTRTAILADSRAPDLTDLDSLVGGLRDGGLPLTVVVEVDPEQVSPRSSQLAYRIIQEGTTNVIRHAGCARTTVQVARRSDALLVRVRNAGSERPGPRPGPGGGRGITGLRERVLGHGGELVAEPLEDGGFELVATMPLRDLG